MGLNTGQQAAFDDFSEFAENPESTLFALFGPAGTGKSFTSGRMLDVIRPKIKRKVPAVGGGTREIVVKSVDEMLWLAPTWKAVRIAGRFLEQNGLTDYEIGFDAYHHKLGNLVLTTTQQALGLRPVIDDEQTAETVSFARVGKGLIGRLRPKWIVIDEVSMLSWQHLKDLSKACKEVGTKILILGDPNQLPPVKAQEIKWDAIVNRRELSEIMRQSGESAIPHFGRAVLDGDDWSNMTGAGLTRSTRAVSQFIEEVERPSLNEEDWTVFIGYRNTTVDRVQEAAAQRVYGHSATEFAPGEVVIAQSAFHNQSGMVIANQDQLEILSIDGFGEWGQLVKVRNLAGRTVYVEYLSGADMVDPRNPYRVELSQRLKTAQALQEEWRGRKGDEALNNSRKAAWASFFDLKDRTVLNFAHPFAITSHKSQGSSYHRAFIAAQELAQFSDRSLYVAATRPKTELVY
jgi:hypothetical protein